MESRLNEYVGTKLVVPELDGGLERVFGKVRRETVQHLGKELQEEKERVILRMGSPTPGGFAIEAARQLRARERPTRSL